jgi:hypothetical protein
VTLNQAEYNQAMQVELDYIRELMSEEWGEVPDVEVVAEPAVMVKAKFNMKGFAHKGGFILVHDGNQHRRTPQKVAKMVMSELTAHRNTCVRCGLGVASIYQRIWHFRARLFDWHRSKPWTTFTEHSEPRLDENGKQVTETVQMQDGSTWEQPKWDKVKQRADVEPDAVERYLEPARSRKLSKMIREYHAAVAEEAAKQAAKLRNQEVFDFA